MPDIRGSFRSFPAAEQYFRNKVNLPTQRWDDLMRGEHARAFVVAGATRDALLTDLREAVDAAILALLNSDQSTSPRYLTESVSQYTKPPATPLPLCASLIPSSRR